MGKLSFLVSPLPFIIGKRGFYLYPPTNLGKELDPGGSNVSPNRNDQVLEEDEGDYHTLCSEKIPSLRELLIEQDLHDAGLTFSVSLSRILHFLLVSS